MCIWGITDIIENARLHVGYTGTVGGGTVVILLKIHKWNWSQRQNKLKVYRFVKVCLWPEHILANITSAVSTLALEI